MRKHLFIAIFTLIILCGCAQNPPEASVPETSPVSSAIENNTANQAQEPALPEPETEPEPKAEDIQAPAEEPTEPEPEPEATEASVAVEPEIKEPKPIIEGDAFYLDEPVELEDNCILKKLVFTKDELWVVFTGGGRIVNAFDDYGVFVIANGKTYAQGGGGPGGGGNLLIMYNKTDTGEDGLYSYDFYPISRVTFTLFDKSYEIDLTEGEAPYGI